MRPMHSESFCLKDDMKTREDIVDFRDFLRKVMRR